MEFSGFSLCDSIIEFRSKSEIEIQILVTIDIFAEAAIPITADVFAQLTLTRLGPKTFKFLGVAGGTIERSRYSPHL